MELKYNVVGAERKRLVEAIARYMECDVRYLGAPSFAYEVDYCTVSRDGTLSFDDQADRDEVEMLVEALLEKGYEPEPQFEDLRMTGEEELGLGRQRRDPWGEDGMQASDVPDGDDSEETGNILVISYPRSGMSDGAVENLRLLVASKETLIKKALGVERLPIEANDKTVNFLWFDCIPQTEEIYAYTAFTGKLIEMARAQKRITAKEKETDNEKYAFRCFLLRLGFIGDEYKAARKILLRNLSGSGAFKSGQKKGFSQEDLDRAKADPAVRAEVNSILNAEDGEDDE